MSRLMDPRSPRFQIFIEDAIEQSELCSMNPGPRCLESGQGHILERMGSHLGAPA